ncbi:U2 snRNP-associated SURP domain-containing protein [Cladochytrium tenue]|nr:U2 snRNP-associated SURP domain-containing protein [Cladochytrium tenue]
MGGSKRVDLDPDPPATASAAVVDTEDGELDDRDEPKKKLPPSLQISKEKMQAFQLGLQKKTPFQKAKEAEEARRKAEEDAAARVYVDFVASLEADTGKPKAWVKGATIVPAAMREKDDPDKDGTTGSLYRPRAKFSLEQVSKAPDPATTPSTAQPRKKRQLDAFLEEIKQSQEGREGRMRAKTAGDGSGGAAAAPAAPVSSTLADGSHDTGDPKTTNLYVGNIHPQVDEMALCRAFAVHGPIASVKVMWPRTQEERERNRNCGFVSFMVRADAERAVKALDGTDLMGYVMRVGWGKAVPIPAQPIYAHSTSALAGAAATKAHQGKPEVRVQIPEDPLVLARIHRMVERVVQHGSAFEIAIMEREWNNPKFSFLFQNDSPEHAYYRWKLYSILQGDGKTQWPTEPFAMFDEGPVWVPPPIPFEDQDLSDYELLSPSDSDASGGPPIRAVPAAQKGALSRRHRIKLEAAIRRLTLDRVEIGTAMIFCIDHSDAAEEIVDVLVKSLTLPGTPMYPTKVARLYLLSDVLHNSSSAVPNAWRYRALLERRLPAVFEHLGAAHRSISARLRAEHARRAVFAAVTAWERWNVFNRDLTEALRTRFAEAGRAAEEAARRAADAARRRDEDFQRVLREQREAGAGVFALDEDDARNRADADDGVGGSAAAGAGAGAPAPGFVRSGWTSATVDDAAHTGGGSTATAAIAARPGFVPIATTSERVGGAAAVEPASASPAARLAAAGGPASSVKRRRPLPIQSKLFVDADDGEDAE